MLEVDDIPARAKVLVVEDDENILNLLSAYLENEGHDVVVCTDGQAGLDTALAEQFDLYILDVMLPNMNGTEIARTLRYASSTTPVLFLSALGREADVLDGFAAGADDYVIKPFSPRELLVRIDAILRRSSSCEAPADSAFEVGPIRLDIEQPVCIVLGRAVTLTPYEHRILKRLLERPGRVLDRGQLVATLYGNACAVSPKAIDVHVHNLRAKLGDEAGRLIETVRGFGYKLTSPAPSRQIQKC